MKTPIVILSVFIATFMPLNAQQSSEEGFHIGKAMGSVVNILHIDSQTKKPWRGTAFLITFKNKSYLVSAKHIFPDAKNQDSVDMDFYYNNKWNHRKYKILLHPDDSVDIAVFPYPRTNNKFMSLAESGSAIWPGQSGFLMGFPMSPALEGLMGESSGLNNGFPFPLLRTVSFSATTSMRGVLNDSLKIGILDGRAVKGFSGGPIVFTNSPEPTVSGSWEGLYVFGVAFKSYIYQEYILMFWSDYIRQIIEANE